jgi:dihydroflavonol-4-reductase
MTRRREAEMSTVLVTGGSGFVGSHCILQLLAAGRQVRTTVRNLKREADVRALLRAGGADAGDRLSFFVADLEKDSGWREAAAGCDFVLHVASPFPVNVPNMRTNSSFRRVMVHCACCGPRATLASDVS